MTFSIAHLLGRDSTRVTLPEAALAGKPKTSSLTANLSQVKRNRTHHRFADRQRGGKEDSRSRRCGNPVALAACFALSK
jgi:hypothetical protein